MLGIFQTLIIRDLAKHVEAQPKNMQCKNDNTLSRDICYVVVSFEKDSSTRAAVICFHFEYYVLL